VQYADNGYSRGGNLWQLACSHKVSNVRYSSDGIDVYGSRGGEFES